MKKLSLTDTQELINSYVKSFGQCGAAQKLNEQGYRSPTGAQILQAHIYRILHGSGTCILAPETENQQQEPPITKEPIAPIPKIQKRLVAELFADEKLLEAEITRTAKELREELLEEEAALQELERSMPPMVPLIEDRLCKQHRHLEQDARVSGIFSPRNPIELDETQSFFGIPLLKHPQPATICRPYQQRRYNRNVLSTRDLYVREK